MEHLAQTRSASRAGCAPSVALTVPESGNSRIGSTLLPRGVSMVLMLGLALFVCSCQEYFGSARTPENGPSEAELAALAQAEAARQQALQETGQMLRAISSARPGEMIQIGEIRLESTPLLRDFYANMDFLPVWSLDSEHHEALVGILHRAADYGLDPGDYLNSPLLSRMELDSKALTPRARAERDLLLTDAYFRFGKHLHLGLLPEDSLQHQWHHKPGSPIPPLVASLAAGLSSDIKHFRAGVLGLQPGILPYQELQQALASFRASVANPADTGSPMGISSIPSWREDSALAYGLAAEILMYKGLLDSATLRTDSGLLHVLQDYQRQHGLEDDGRIGKRTAEALLLSNAERAGKLTASLERWRHDQRWSDTCLYVNIPAYKLQVRRGEEYGQDFRVVVGKPSDATPEITSELKYMVAFPFWNVPRSISTEELLPKQQGDSTYLGRNRYTIFDRSGEVVDPGQIDWTSQTVDNFEYRIRQDGGSFNALGTIKFIFPNPHSVYIHDTNAKRYFSVEDRALSHGCVRIDKPMELAYMLLERDGAAHHSDSLESWIDSETRRRIDLDRPMPIYIRYRTAGVDQEGQAVFYRDVYNLDTELQDRIDSARLAWKSGVYPVDPELEKKLIEISGDAGTPLAEVR